MQNHWMQEHERLGQDGLVLGRDADETLTNRRGAAWTAGQVHRGRGGRLLAPGHSRTGREPLSLSGSGHPPLRRQPQPPVREQGCLTLLGLVATRWKIALR